MLKTLFLILPVLIPSWRFFKAIEPSPRVQWGLMPSKGAAPEEWHVFRPRPEHVSPLLMVRCLFWNAPRNEVLFVISCAERIAEVPDDHSIHEINRRILTDLAQTSHVLAGHWMQFRLVFVRREQAGLTQEVLFTSVAVPAERGGRYDV